MCFVSRFSSGFLPHASYKPLRRSPARCFGLLLLLSLHQQDADALQPLQSLPPYTDPRQLPTTAAPSGGVGADQHGESTFSTDVSESRKKGRGRGGSKALWDRGLPQPGADAAVLGLADGTNLAGERQWAGVPAGTGGAGGAGGPGDKSGDAESDGVLQGLAGPQPWS